MGLVNLKIGVRLGLGFTVVVVMMLVVGGFSISKTNQRMKVEVRGERVEVVG